jgi:hypothetical protein
MSETMEQRVGHNPCLTSWRDLIRILLSFRWFHIVVVVVIVWYKRGSSRIKLITTTMPADTMSLFIYMKKLHMIRIVDLPWIAEVAYLIVLLLNILYDLIIIFQI